MNTQDLINNIKSGDAAASNNSFNSIMADKMNSALDVRKHEVASAMYGAEAPIEEPEVKNDTDV